MTDEEINDLLEILLTNYFSTSFNFTESPDGRIRTFDAEAYRIIFPFGLGLTKPTEKEIERKVTRWLQRANLEKGFAYTFDKDGSCTQDFTLSDYQE